MRILVADQDPASRSVAQAALRDLGHDCVTVSDGDAAWAVVSDIRPAVVISDWSLPGVSGLELCRRVRADAGTYAYFIMLTSEGGLPEILRGMRAGVDDYLIKPLDIDDLQARLIAAERVTALHAALDIQRGEIEWLNRDLTAIARRDLLTGMGNRRALEEDLEILEARVIRYGHGYSMGMLDVDHFKAYNDAYGHQAGDEILRVVADQIRQQARTGDALYRYGGEEFLCVFPEQVPGAGALALERMRAGIQRLAIAHRASPVGVLTVSGGLAVLDPDRPRSADAVLKRADEALYRAKDLGRNRIEEEDVVEDPPVPLQLVAPRVVVPPRASASTGRRGG